MADAIINDDKRRCPHGNVNDVINDNNDGGDDDDGDDGARRRPNDDDDPTKTSMTMITQRQRQQTNPPTVTPRMYLDKPSSPQPISIQAPRNSIVENFPSVGGVGKVPLM